MKEKIIKAYVNKLTKNDIIWYAQKENITLNQLEIDYIYDTIKNDINLILRDPLTILNRAKNVLNINAYNKIHELFSLYYPKLNH